jgi:hypothetical protein
MSGAFDGNTHANWVGGDLNFLGSNGTFDMNMNSPYLTSGRGTLHLAFSGGVVTQSTSTGVFAGQAPGVGQSSAFTSHFGDSNGDFNMDYDFGAANTNGFNFDIAFEGNGFVEAVPEPCSLLAIGLGAGLFACRRRKAGEAVGPVGLGLAEPAEGFFGCHETAAFKALPNGAALGILWAACGSPRALSAFH